MSIAAQGIRQFVKKAISDNTIMVFSKSYCPYCKGAKELLDDLNVKYNALELDQRGDGADIQQALADLTGQKTVPNIFINQQHIGGFSALEELNQTGKLQPLLEKVRQNAKL